MNKIIITTLLLCMGLITAGCEKTYSVAEFKKDRKLMDEWGAKCGFAGTSKNCENLRLAAAELDREYQEKAPERRREAMDNFHNTIEKLIAKKQAEYDKWKAEKKAKEQAKKEAEKQQDNN
ncbi:EexN family lipoprotein [Bartonella gliris]|uniref:EexN family lipoprotein n=1 Tax=Bartonella gliris TaxID=3004109 RepID=UPI00295F3FBF|nr:EexN family lipoprotein [Bartonella gliris]